MSSVRTDWAWQPDATTVAAITRGNAKFRSSTSTTKEKIVATKKTAKKAPGKKAGKKLDGKALAAKRKPRDSVAQFIMDELTAGTSDVDKIIERAKKDFPKAKPTRGYVRWVAKQIGKEKQVAAEPRAKAEKPKSKPAKKAAKKSAPKKAAEPRAPESKSDAPDPAS